jgi:hypothetical protein
LIREYLPKAARSQPADMVRLAQEAEIALLTHDKFRGSL